MSLHRHKGKVNFSTACLTRWLVVGALWVCCARISNAEIIQGHTLAKSESDLNAPQKVFDSTDFLRICLEPMPKKSFMVGEPVPLGFRIVNHTQHEVILNLHFDMRNGFEIKIEDGRSPARRYNGPFQATGNFPPFELKMYPLEERPFQFLIWADRDSNTGLAFPQPGRYAVKFTLRVSVPGLGLTADMPPLDPITLAPAKPIVFEVIPAEATLAPLVNLLLESKAFPDLNLRQLPENNLEKYENLVEQYPATVLTPYITFMLALHYNYLATAMPKDEEVKTKSSMYYQMTAKADSYVRAEAWEAALRLYDQWGLAEPAREAALKMIEFAPRQVAPQLGSMEIVKKYLPNSVEMAPDKYWDLLN